MVVLYRFLDEVRVRQGDIELQQAQPHRYSGVIRDYLGKEKRRSLKYPFRGMQCKRFDGYLRIGCDMPSNWPPLATRVQLNRRVTVQLMVSTPRSCL